MPEKEKTFILTGYGTLLLRESLGDTVSTENATEKKYLPIIIKDYKRLFNLFPDHYPIENRIGHGEIEHAAANIEPSPGHHLNGLAFRVTESELEQLDKRERYYQRAEATILNFQTHEDMGTAFVYMSDPNERWIERDNDKLLPLWRDIVYARVGSYRINDAFGKMYDETTFMADGQTLLVDYYAEYLDQLAILER